MGKSKREKGGTEGEHKAEHREGEHDAVVEIREGTTLEASSEEGTPTTVQGKAEETLQASGSKKNVKQKRLFKHREKARTVQEVRRSVYQDHITNKAVVEGLRDA